jgi:D-alanine transaminase
MIVKNSIVFTAPLSNYILPGITRNVVLDLCRQLSIPAQERIIAKDELLDADEVFLVGTTLEITPIIKVDDKEIADSTPGVICRKLQEAFHDMVYSPTVQ